MAITVGIDLGTTNSLIAVMGDDGPELIANSLGELLTPSIVAVDQDGAVLVGRAAKELQVRFPDRCASIFKRFMGSDWTTKIAGKSFSAKELSSLVLRSLKSDAEAKLGQPVVDAVITVPAYFNERQRTDTIEAGKLAGLNVRRIINEPTAAAMAYGQREHASERILTVVDLGGGTFEFRWWSSSKGLSKFGLRRGRCSSEERTSRQHLSRRSFRPKGSVWNPKNSAIRISSHGYDTSVSRPSES